MCPPRPKRSNKNREREMEDSCVDLRARLGNDDTVPREIHFTGGTPVRIDTNCYDLTLRNDSQVHQYDVQLEPEILDSRLITHFLYSAICPNGGPMSQNERWHRIIFDGQKIVYSPLEDLGGVYEVAPREGHGSDKIVTVKVTHSRVVQGDDREGMLAIYNTAFRKAYREIGLQNFRRKWMDESNTKRAGHFTVVGGYLPSVASLQGGLSYLIDVTSRFDRNQTLYEFLREAVQDPSRRSSMLAALSTLQIQAVHRPTKPRTVTVSNVLWDKTPDNAFFTKVDKKTGSETQISLAQYFAEVYNHQCKRDDVVIEMVSRRAGQESVNLFPSSVLKWSGITDMERCDGATMRDIATVTRIAPDVRKSKLDAFVSKLKSSEASSQFFEKWGCEIGESRKLTGMSIQAPKLQMARQGTSTPAELNLDPKRLGWQQDLKNHALYSVSKFKSNCLIVAASVSREPLETRFVPGLKKVVGGLNVALPTIDVRYVDNTHPNDFKLAIATYMKENAIPSFVIVVLPTDERARYDSIKTFLTVDIGVPSQMVKEDTVFGDKGLSVFTNIAIQIASKTGGVPYKVSQEYLATAHTMVIGLAMTATKGGAPVAAAVASNDQGFTQFYSDSCAIEQGGGYISDDFLKGFVKGAMERYKEVNNCYPERVVVYRDGVSYGQMPKLKKFEVPVIQESLTEVAGAEVSLCFIIAQKHGSIRVLNANDSRVKNAEPGTVVTEGIGAQDVAEFYLISHYANQGAASPTRYTIIHHSPVTWKDDQIILMTHYQTLQYPNWSGAIRIPACLMLASRLAELSKQHLGSNQANRNLVNFLHYL